MTDGRRVAAMDGTHPILTSPVVGSDRNSIFPIPCFN